MTSWPACHRIWYDSSMTFKTHYAQWSVQIQEVPEGAFILPRFVFDKTLNLVCPAARSFFRISVMATSLYYSLHYSPLAPVPLYDKETERNGSDKREEMPRIERSVSHWLSKRKSLCYWYVANADSTARCWLTGKGRRAEDRWRLVVAHRSGPAACTKLGGKNRGTPLLTATDVSVSGKSSSFGHLLARDTFSLLSRRIPVLINKVMTRRRKKKKNNSRISER